MTVRENVQTRPARARRGSNAASARAPRDRHVGDADALLERVGLAALADQSCATLAYGDAKRVELAMALAERAEAAADGRADRRTARRSCAAGLMQLAADLARSDGIAVLFTEHDMDVVFGHADRVIVLDRGRVISRRHASGDSRRPARAGGLPRHRLIRLTPPALRA